MINMNDDDFINNSNKINGHGAHQSLALCGTCNRRKDALPQSIYVFQFGQ